MRANLHIATVLAAALFACAALLAAPPAGDAFAAPRLAAPSSSSTGVAPRIDPSGSRGASSSTSTNWSGYSVTGGPFTSVTATWTQPKITAGPVDSYAAFWVGLDGDGSDTVEQIGTLGYASAGRAYYAAWYEMYPAPMVEIDSLAVSPGDVVTATVEWTDAYDFRLSLTDRTTGQTYSVTRANTQALRASAEVVAEAPSNGSGILPLAAFGLASFTGCAVDGQSLATVGASSIDMVDSAGKVIAATSALGADGAAFTVTDDFTPPTVTATGLRGSATRGWTNAPVRVTLKASDGSGGSGVAAVYYTVDGLARQTYSGAFKVSGAGSHPVQYWAVDRAGNTGSPKTGYVNLDLTAPKSVPAPLRLGRAAARRGRIVAVPVTVSDAPPSSGTVTLVTRVIAGSHTVAKITKTGVAANGLKTVRLRLRSSLTRGRYSVRTTATDAAGNVQKRAGRATLTVR